MTVSTNEATRIAERAVSLWERMRGPEDRDWPDSEPLEQSERRLERWRRVVAKGDPVTFQRRLAWDGWTLPAVQAALARAEAPAQPPPWLPIFVEVIHAVRSYRRNPPSASARDRDRPRPFEDVVLPLVHAARRRLHRAMHCHASAELPRGLLSDQAHLSLERGLLDRLCRVCAPSLQSDFSSVRPAGHSLLNVLIGPTGTASTKHYTDFVSRLLSDDLMPMFDRYPVLARLVVGVIEHWVTYCAEFQSHLGRDVPLIDQCFRGTSEGALGEVVELRFGLSDFHHHGRCVLGLRFSCGLELAYKPKPLGIDRAFNEIVEWCNRQGPTLDLKAVRVLDRPGTVGWSGWTSARARTRTTSGVSTGARA